MIMLIVVFLIALALAWLRVNYEIRKQESVYKKFDETIAYSLKALDRLEKSLSKESRLASAPKLNGVYYSGKRIDIMQMLSRPDLYLDSLAPEYEQSPRELIFNGKIEYCESIAS